MCGTWMGLTMSQQVLALVWHHTHASGTSGIVCGISPMLVTACNLKCWGLILSFFHLQNNLTLWVTIKGRQWPHNWLEDSYNNIATKLSEYVRVLDWQSDLLSSYTTHDYTSQITITQADVLSHVAASSGRPSASGFTSLQADDHPTPTSYFHCRLKALKLPAQDIALARPAKKTLSPRFLYCCVRISCHKTDVYQAVT
jgi:hypothetical protein